MDGFPGLNHYELTMNFVPATNFENRLAQEWRPKAPPRRLAPTPSAEMAKRRAFWTRDELKLLTLNETAKVFGKSRRWLQKWLRDHPVDSKGKPFYSQVGRTKWFRRNDIDRILDANMIDIRCQSDSSRPAPVKRRTIHSEERTSASMWTEALELLRKR
jgi:hypothetical protein